MDVSIDLKGKWAIILFRRRIATLPSLWGSAADLGPPRMTIDITSLKTWIGRQETVSDTVTKFPSAALSATLGRDDEYQHGTPLPPLWHWIHFHDLHKTSELAENGHEK